MLALLLPFQSLTFLEFLRSAFTMRLALVIAGFFTLLSIGFVAVRVAAESVSCPASEALLVYSQYDRKGIATAAVERCGAPHRSCKIRDMYATHPVYDCSPFMMPKLK